MGNENKYEPRPDAEEKHFNEFLPPKSSRCEFTKGKCIMIFLIGLVIIAGIASIATVFVIKAYQDMDTQRVEFVAEMVLMEDWSAELADLRSREFKQKVTEIETALDTVFMNGKLSKVYESAKVRQLRKGSVIVYTIVVLKVIKSDVKMEDGSVLLVLENSDSSVDAVSLIKENVLSVNLKIDKTKVSVRVLITTTQALTTRVGTAIPTTSSRQTSIASTGPVPTIQETITTSTVPVTTTKQATTTEKEPAATTLQSTTPIVPAATIQQTTTSTEPARTTSQKTTTSTQPMTTTPQTTTTLTQPETPKSQTTSTSTHLVATTQQTTTSTRPETTTSQTTTTSTQPETTTPQTTTTSTQPVTTPQTTTTSIQPVTTTPQTTTTSTEPVTTTPQTTTTSTQPVTTTPQTTTTLTSSHATTTRQTTTRPTRPRTTPPQTTAMQNGQAATMRQTTTSTKQSTTQQATTSSKGPAFTTGQTSTTSTDQQPTRQTTTSTKSTATGQETLTTSSGVPKLSAVHGTVVLSQPWSESLRDRSSSDYSQLEAMFQSEVNSVINKTPLKEKLVAVNITDISPGSVLIDFLMAFKDLLIALENDTSGALTPNAILSSIQQAAFNTSSDFRWTSALIGACPRGQKYCAQPNRDVEVVCIPQETDCQETPSIQNSTPTDGIQNNESISVNCTFEEGSCGYVEVRPFRFFDKIPWKRVQVKDELQNFLTPVNDHTTASDEGHVMLTELTVDAWSNLASRKFTPNQRESCLTFHWFTMCRNIKSSLRVYASANDDTRVLQEMHLFSFRQHSRYPITRFVHVDITLPPLTNQIFFQLRSDARKNSLNSLFSRSLDDAVAVSLDDVLIKPGECLQEPVSCSFPDAGLFGYQQLFLTQAWFTDFTNASNPANKDRHLVFRTDNEEVGYIASPVFQSTNTEACLSFEYKFDGALVGSLSVHLVSDILPEKMTEFVGERVWSLSSSSHVVWRSVKIPLDQSEAKFYRVVWEGRGKGGSRDLIRVDNIVLNANPCTMTACAETEFRCKSTLTCIPQTGVCNSIRDCSDSDMSDEQNEECASLESVTCSFNPKNSFFCGYANASDSGIWAPKGPPTPVRLMRFDEPAEQTGRVEVFTDGEWRTLCAFGLSEKDASVICKMLGYSKSSVNYTGFLIYGIGQAKTSFVLICDGDEDDIAECSRIPLGLVSCSYSSVAAVTCTESTPKDENTDGGLVSRFTNGDQFGAVADLASRLLECRDNPNRCGSACVSVDFHMKNRHSPVFIFGEDSNGKKSRLWSSHNWNSSIKVVLSNLTGVQRLHFVSYYNNNKHRPLVLKRVTYKSHCDQTTSLPVIDDEMFCDGIVDFESGIDEWGQQCAGNVSVNCTFEEGHMCGYAGVIRSSPWKLSGFREIAQEILALDFFFILPFFEGLVLYFTPSSCANVTSINELRFPQIPELSRGGCLHFYFSNTGNFTLTSPEGHLFHFPTVHSVYWQAVKVELPVGLQSLSLLADCTATFVAIDDVTLSPGSCTSDTTTYNCPAGERFLCNNGKEISCAQTCTVNRLDECGDGSSQNGCVCHETSEFRCDGRCVSASRWCDGHEDCEDGSDELPGCGCQEDKSFTCTRGGVATCNLFYEFCYSLPLLRCEEEKDCCKGCCDPRVSFLCNNGKCINRYDMCNYQNNCGDFSDEMNCTCKGTDFMCPRSGVCVPHTSVCDGYANCPEGEDESENCVMCDKDTEFQCNSGLCLKKSEVCNGHSQCTDREDEVNCPYCSDLTCLTTGYCVSKFSICDGVFDCFSNSVSDISDEINCQCSPGSVRCNNSLCVPENKWCDRVNDCLDGSDEEDCQACPKGDWRCADGKCIRLAFRCDGYVDCRDSSDELSCLTCRNGTIPSCGNSACLHLDRYCDGIADCPDKTDELHCGFIQPLDSMSGAVYFNRSGVPYPVCADSISTDIEFLGDLCHYLFRGGYISHGKIQVDATSNELFLSVRNDSAGEAMTSRFAVGMCVGNPQLSISCRSPTCGKRQGFSRPALQIIGGERSMLGEWPWVGYLYFLGSHRCGVSIINENWVLTAAHCVTENERVVGKRYLSVTVGSIRPTSLRTTGQSRGVSVLIHHEDYGSTIPGHDVPRNDVALLKLARPLDLRRSTVKPICLPRQGERIALNSLCYAAGWGLSIPGKGTSRLLHLNHIRTPIVDSKSCAEDWRNLFGLDGKICAGFRVGHGGGCHGDSGGPLMCQDKLGFWSIEGIVSFGSSLCVKDSELGRVRPLVYARVADYRDWIDDVIRKYT